MCSGLEYRHISLALVSIPLGTFGEFAVAAAIAACGRLSKSDAVRGMASAPKSKRRKRPCVEPPGRIGTGIRAMLLELMLRMMSSPDLVIFVSVSVCPSR